MGDFRVGSYWINRSLSIGKNRNIGIMLCQEYALSVAGRLGVLRIHQAFVGCGLPLAGGGNTASGGLRGAHLSLDLTPPLFTPSPTGSPCGRWMFLSVSVLHI